jgi:hypothetical protein
MAARRFGFTFIGIREPLQWDYSSIDGARKRCQTPTERQFTIPEAE